MRSPWLPVLVALLIAGCRGGDDDPGPPPDGPRAPLVTAADDRRFAEIVRTEERPVLVLFWAPWSGPDRVVLPYLDDVAKERPGLRVVKVDVDDATKTATRYEILSIPTAMVLKDGERVGRPVTGAYPRERWERDLELDEVAPER